MKEVIGIGETIIQAQEDACRQLGVNSQNVEFEVLQLPIKKAFGFLGGKPAQVRAFIKEIEPVAPQIVISAEKPACYTPHVTIENPVEIARAYVYEVLEAFGVKELEIKISEDLGSGAVLNISGEGLNPVIGRHGTTLDALQYLANLVANHARADYFSIRLDVGNYREKREKALENLGAKIALRAIKTHRSFTLEPMSPYDRRIIHLIVRKYKGVESRSQGEGINRHVVIVPLNTKRVVRQNRYPAPAKKDKFLSTGLYGKVKS